MKLLLCAGQMKWEGWTTLDGEPSNNPDICAIVPPIPLGPWEEIALIHGIEHFKKAEGLELLRGCQRELILGGVLVLEQPDISQCCKVILGQIEPPSQQFPDQFGLAGIYGDPRYDSPFMLHKWGYTPQTLTDLLVEAGFDGGKVRMCEPLYHSRFRDFRLEVTK